MSGHCEGRCLGDDEAIEVVELMVLAMEMCRTAHGFVSAALQRVCAMGTDTTELHRDAARLAAMLSWAGLAEPVSGDQR